MWFTVNEVHPDIGGEACVDENLLRNSVWKSGSVGGNKREGERLYYSEMPLQAVPRGGLCQFQKAKADQGDELWVCFRNNAKNESIAEDSTH